MGRSFKSNTYGSLALKLNIICSWLTLAGCNVSGGISSKFRSVDFEKSEIISNGPAYADGQAELLMVVQLMNSDNSAVKDYKPTYEVVSGAAVNATECTTSNANGVSTCVLKSTVAGTKRVKVTNIKVDLQKDLVFINPPAGKAMMDMAPATKKQTSGTHILNANLGNPVPQAVKTTGTHKLYGGFQGEVFSR